MKKILIISALVLTLVTSVAAGTLANYTTALDNVANGSVTAKEFVLTGSGSDSFKKDVKIAPTETVSWQFSVKNFNGSTVSETAMDLAFNVDVKSSEGKKAIDPLVVSVLDEKGNVVGTQTGTGTIKFNDGFGLSDKGQTKTYTVKIEWPSNDKTDINYAGSGYGTAINVSVTGTQK